ncbi:MAG: hypothetical protein IRY99_02120 [Isosphaeraceae bacterium]|nr:hypothetical protein [Isosphaeraceae bacterium]
MRYVLSACCALLTAIPLQAGDAPLTAAETRAFMKELLEYVRDHHLKQDPKSAQAGMLYEYYDTSKAGRLGQWVQGEALDTMHDGAWFVAALAQAYRATGDPAYADFLRRWPLPFYLKMLNHSDELFSPERDDSCGRIKFDREHLLQPGEKGFVPYWWDDGASVSLEGRLRVGGRAAYPCRDDLAGQPNPEARLSGYSLGCSNHLAQDLGVMLLAVWPLAEAEKGPLAMFRGDLADAARNLADSRLRHHGHIPAVDAALGGITGAEAVLRRLPARREWDPANEYSRIHDSFQPGERIALPGFADNQEYVYWSAVARTRREFDPVTAQALVYDTFTLPQLYRAWSDNAPVPPGMNRFDLTTIFARDGKMESYRSDRPVGSGSRFGPQNMVLCGRALQMLDAYPGLWEQRYRRRFAGDLLVRFVDDLPALDDTTDAGLSTPVTLGTTKVALAADPAALFLAGEFKGAEATLVLSAKPDGQGRRATVVLKKDGISATGVDGAPLRCESRVIADSMTVRFRIRLPFMVDKNQGPWWTGIEHGRYSIRSGDASRNFYLLSSEERVRRGLLTELTGGLRTWRDVFRARGFIPTGINANPVGTVRSENLSDTGGYAHLIAAGAQYLLYLDHQRDWRQTLPK